MKFKIALMVLTLAVLCILPWFIKKQDGTPLMTLPQVDTQLSTEQTRQTFYKWQDASGNWHFGDEVPEGVTAVAVNIDTAANVVQGLRPPQPESTATQSAPVTTPGPQSTSPLPGLPMTVNPADIPKLIDDAKNIQNLVNERARQTEQTR